MSKTTQKQVKIQKPAASYYWAISVGIFLLVLFSFFAISVRKPLSSNQPVFEITNFYGQPEIFVADKGKWMPLSRGSFVNGRDKIRTGTASEVDLKVGEGIRLQLKENSELQGEGPVLNYGTLLWATDLKAKDPAPLDIGTPVFKGRIQGNGLLSMDAKKKSGWLGLLRGSAELRERSLVYPRGFTLKGLQKAEVKEDRLGPSPLPISREEWMAMRDAYELIQRSAAQEAMQIDLAKEAGSLFDFIFDHGNFFTPKIGFANREFSKEDDTGKVHLQIEYDVFPLGSYVGMYMKTRNLDLLKFESLNFIARPVAEEAFPEAFRIEFKSRAQVIRAYQAKFVKDKPEQALQFKIQTTRSIPVDEIAFVFTHAKVGERKKGTIQLESINLIPRKEPPPPSVQEAALAETAAPTSAVPVVYSTPDEKSPEELLDEISQDTPKNPQEEKKDQLPADF